jgi:hypothetical protein
VKGRLALGVALCAATVVVAGGLAAATGHSGVTGRTLVIGGTAPLTGEASSAAAVARGEVAKLKASKADTFMIVAFGKLAIQAFVDANKLGWRPRIFVNAVASSASLQKAGRNLSRESLLKAVSLNEQDNPFVIPGIAIATSPTDHFPMQQVGLQRSSGDHWVGLGGIVGA